MTAAVLLERLEALGMVASVDGADLVLDGATENLPPDLVDDLRACKPEILALLAARAAASARELRLYAQQAARLLRGLPIDRAALYQEYAASCREEGTEPASLDAFLAALERAEAEEAARPLAAARVAHLPRLDPEPEAEPIPASGPPTVQPRPEHARHLVETLGPVRFHEDGRGHYTVPAGALGFLVGTLDALEAFEPDPSERARLEALQRRERAAHAGDPSMVWLAGRVRVLDRALLRPLTAPADDRSIELEERVAIMTEGGTRE